MQTLSFEKSKMDDMLIDNLWVVVCGSISIAMVQEDWDYMDKKAKGLIKIFQPIQYC